MKQNTASARVLADLRDRIRSGKIQPGQLVPSARQIVKEWDVAIATATKVLAQLRKDGLVRVEPGIGTVVKGEAAPDLSRDRIVEAAIAIADDEGTAALSMRTVAKELGVATMSLYRHVPSKEMLFNLMADSALAEAELPKARGGWRKHLEALMRVQWDGYRRHRWLAPMISLTRPQQLPRGMLHTEAVLATIAATGIPDAEVLTIAISLIGFVRGLAAGFETEREAERDTGMDQSEWMASQEAVFAPLVAKLPTLLRLGAIEVDMSLDALFETGLRVFLDGLAVVIDRGNRR
ncbi:MAG: TetR/AcrR family transcriptional regulator C-terminal domain-containing protein [Kofleriaceae bacterium]